MGGSNLWRGTLPLKLKCMYSGLCQEELEGCYFLLNLELTTFNKTSKKQHFNFTWFFICCNYSSLQLACHVILYLDHISNSSFGILRAFIAWFRIKKKNKEKMPVIPNECSSNYCFCRMNTGSCFQRKKLACSEVGAFVQFLYFLSVIGSGIKFQDWGQ